MQSLLKKEMEKFGRHHIKLGEEAAKIDDGGERISFDTGAVREPTSGKGRFDLISLFAMNRLARWYELGAGKYAPRNWEKGIPFSRCLDSALRHINKYQRGMRDEDHLAAAVWNRVALLHFEETGQDEELNDLPDYITEAGEEFDV